MQCVGYMITKVLMLHHWLTVIYQVTVNRYMVIMIGFNNQSLQKSLNLLLMFEWEVCM